MIKHIAGIVLFSFIVGSSAVIAGLFYEVPEAKTITIRESYSVFKKKKRKKRCRNRRSSIENASVNLHFAKFDVDRENGFSAIIDYQNNWKSNGVVDLHFFVNDKYGTRFLKTERIYVATGIDDYSKKMDWMGRLDSRENLYIIPEVHNAYEKWTSPEFNIYEAVEVRSNND